MSLERESNVNGTAGIPDLLRRLADDSKRLANDEVRLAKLELRENVHSATRGGLRLAIAFGAGTIALVTLTVALVAIFGRILGDRNYWAGALIVGVLELVAAGLLIRRGVKSIGSANYTLPETRASLQNTKVWAAAQRAD
jgi:uncharacterized membrane protein YqjE